MRHVVQFVGDDLPAPRCAPLADVLHEKLDDLILPPGAGRHCQDLFEQVEAHGQRAGFDL